MAKVWKATQADEQLRQPLLVTHHGLGVGAPQAPSAGDYEVLAGQPATQGGSQQGLGYDPNHLSSEDAAEVQKAMAAADAEYKVISRRQLLGLFLYAVSTVFGTLMSLMAKLAGQHGIGVFEVVLFRSLFLLGFTAPELVWRRVNPLGDPVRRWLYLLRGVLGYLSVSSLYLAVSLLPMGDAAVLSFLSPIFVAALSPLVLRERPSKGLILAIPFCMAGVVLVSKPSFIFHDAKGAISPVGVGVGVLQAVFNASARMAVRALSIGSSEPMAAILFSMGLVSSVLAAATMAGLRTFIMPRGMWTVVILLVNGLSGYLYQVTLTAGLQRADAAPAVAMSYLGVIWGIAADIFVFSTPPTALSLAGAAIISASSFLVAYGEKRKQAKAKARLRLIASQERLAELHSGGASQASASTGNLRALLGPGGDYATSPAPARGPGHFSFGRADTEGDDFAAAAAVGATPGLPPLSPDASREPDLVFVVPPLGGGTGGGYLEEEGGEGKPLLAVPGPEGYEEGEGVSTPSGHDPRVVPGVNGGTPHAAEPVLTAGPAEGAGVGLPSTGGGLGGPRGSGEFVAAEEGRDAGGQQPRKRK